ncbi:MAG TPA: YeeE/YedE thiosulfate transporter family protein [Myxococcaceae bacterium]|nr:YeeE/YedE thiosulfate transporter family protein [Myxococcaceae bacterium]
MDLSSLIPPLVGGALIGLSASLMLLFNGRVAGISGIVGGLIAPMRGDTSWRVLFFVGLLVGGVLLRLVRPESFGAPAAVSPGGLALLAGAGVLVGIGSRLGNGCTSGHGVCGISRGSVRSIAATVTFMATGMLTVFVVRHLL